MSQLIRDTLAGELRLVESKERKRPGVLAVVEGTFFVADKPSRNGRVYPRGLWENVLSSAEFKRMLNSRLLFGTVGHAEEQLDDLIREGKISHVVTEIRILPDGSGVGKADILDTPVGKVLKTLFESGSKLSVSSKAYGDYEGQTSEGHWRVSSQNFILERFDFVVDPGFLEAQPTVKEVYESVVKTQCNNGVLAKLIEEKSKQEGRVVQLLKEVESREKELNELRESVEKFNKLRNGILEKEIEKIGDILVEKFGISEERIESDSLLGVVRNIRKVIESMDFQEDDEHKAGERKVDEPKGDSSYEEESGYKADAYEVVNADEHEIDDGAHEYEAGECDVDDYEVDDYDMCDDADGCEIDDYEVDDYDMCDDEHDVDDYGSGEYEADSSYMEDEMIEVPVDLEVDDSDIDDVISDIVSNALGRKIRVSDCDFWEEGDDVLGAGEFLDGKVYVVGKKLSSYSKIYLVSAIITINSGEGV